MNLFDFSEKRNWKSSIAFYFLYMFVGVLLGGLICAAIAVCYCSLHESQCAVDGYNIGQALGRRYGIILVLLYHFGLGAWLLTSKNLWSSVPSVILYLLSIPISALGGCFLGLIPLAVISTFDNGKNESEDSQL